MLEWIFSYGTLQTEKVQLALFGRKLQESPDTLAGYKASAIEIKDELFLSKGNQKHQLIAARSEDRNDSIRGMALAVTMEELLMADKYEPVDYKRIQVVLESGKQAWIYVTIDTI